MAHSLPSAHPQSTICPPLPIPLSCFNKGLFHISFLTAISWYWYPVFTTRSCGAFFRLELFRSQVTQPEGSFCACTLIEKHIGVSTQSHSHFIGWSAVKVVITWFSKATPSSLTNLAILHPTTRGIHSRFIHIILEFKTRELECRVTGWQYCLAFT